MCCGGCGWAMSVIGLISLCIGTTISVVSLATPFWLKAAGTVDTATVGLWQVCPKVGSSLTDCNLILFENQIKDVASKTVPTIMAWKQQFTILMVTRCLISAGCVLLFIGLFVCVAYTCARTPDRKGLNPMWYIIIFLLSIGMLIIMIGLILFSIHLGTPGVYEWSFYLSIVGAGISFLADLFYMISISLSCLAARK